MAEKPFFNRNREKRWLKSIEPKTPSFPVFQKPKPWSEIFNHNSAGSAFWEPSSLPKIQRLLKMVWSIHLPSRLQLICLALDLSISIKVLYISQQVISIYILQLGGCIQRIIYWSIFMKQQVKSSQYTVKNILGVTIYITWSVLLFIFLQLSQKYKNKMFIAYYKHVLM